MNYIHINILLSGKQNSWMTNVKHHAYASYTYKRMSYMTWNVLQLYNIFTYIQKGKKKKPWRKVKEYCCTRFSVSLHTDTCIQPYPQQRRMPFIFYNNMEFSVRVGSLKWVIIPPLSKVQPAGSRSTGKQTIICPTTLNFICPQPLSTDYTINTPQMRRANNWPGQINASK